MSMRKTVLNCTRHILRGIGVLTLCVSLSACLMRSEVVRPDVAVPDKWSEGFSPGAELAQLWWRDFSSLTLNQLMETALHNSPDFIIAQQRIRQAEAVARVAGASLFPSLNLSGSSSERRNQAAGVGASSVSESTSAALAFSYEVDLWGGVDANIRAAQANLLGSRHDLRTAHMALTGGVANAYFQILALRNRITIARDNLAIAERLYKIVDLRYQNGAASALDVSTQLTTVLTQRAALIPLEVQERQTVSALAILLGNVPEQFSVNGDELFALKIPALAAAVPGAVLSRRPDIGKAESQLVASSANLDAARAALFPSLQLGGSAGWSSLSLLSLSNPAQATALTVSLAQNIFDGGRLRGQVQSNEAQQRQAFETYRKALLTALKEVEDALGNVGRYRDQELAQMAIRNEAQRSLRLAELRYKEGAIDMTTLLSTQRTLFSAQDQLVQLRLSRLSGAVDLVKALGGSPSAEAGTEGVPAAQAATAD